MKNISDLRCSLVLGSVLLSISASLNAIPEKSVRGYWWVETQNSSSLQPQALKTLTQLNDKQWEQFKAVVNAVIIPNMSGSARAEVIAALSKVAPEKLFDQRFSSILQKLITPGMNENDQTILMDVLGKVDAEVLFDERFIPVLHSLMTSDMKGGHRVSIIQALEKIDPERWEQFKTTASLLITPDMDGYARFDVISALWNTAPESLFDERFDSLLQSFITSDMEKDERVYVIRNLGDVPKERIDRVYGQIARLMNATQDKLQLNQSRSSLSLIKQLRNCDTDERAVTFTNDLISSINTEEKVDDDGFLSHLHKAWGRVRLILKKN